MNQRLTVQISTALAFGPAGIIWALLPIYLRSLGATYFDISLISLLPAIETVILSPLWGGVLDRTGKANRILLFSFAAQAIGFSFFLVLNTSVGFIVAVAVIGIFSSSFVPVFAAMATVASAHYGRAIGKFWVSASIGYASVTLLGGVVYQYFDPRLLFALGMSYAVAGCAVVYFAPKEMLVVVRSSDPPHGYWGLLKQRRIALLCLLAIGMLVSASAFNNFFTVYLVSILNGSRLVAGLAAAATTILGALAYEYISPLNDKIGRKPVFVLGAAGYAGYYIILYFVTNIAIVTFLWILPIYPLAQSASAALMSDYTSGADRGKGLGLLESAVSLGGGVGPLAGGIIADFAGLQTVILFSLAVALVTLTFSQVFLNDDRKQLGTR